MAKSEPSLVPQWLKSSGGGGHLLSHNQHQEDLGPLSARSGGPSSRGLTGDIPSPFSAQHPFGRHGGGAGAPSGGSHSRAGDWHDRAPLPYSSHSTTHMYPRYGSSNSYRGYDVPDSRGGWDRDRGGGERSQEHWDSRERDVSRSVGFGGGDERDGGGDVIANGSGSGIRPYQPPGRRHEESSHRMMGAGGRGSGVGGDSRAADVTAVVGATSAFSSRLSDKVAFERNFPSLGGGGGSQDRQGHLSPKAVPAGMSPRFPRHSMVHSPRSGLGAAPSPPPLTMPPGISALLNPFPMGSSLAATSALVSPGGDGRALTSVLPADPLSSLAGTPASPGLAGAGFPAGSPASRPLDGVNPSGLHLRAGTQAVLERNRSEEVVIKPLQLVQMKPCLVKNPGVSQRDAKAKPKQGRLMEATSVLGRNSLNGQSVGMDRHRPSELRLPESGRSSPVGPGPMGSAIGGGLGSHSPAGTGITGGSHPLSTSVGRQKTPTTLMDRHHAHMTAPTASVNGGSNGIIAANGRAKDAGLGAAEEKRGGLQSQNRSDFFNALRKKTVVGNGNREVGVEKAQELMGNGKVYGGGSIEGPAVSATSGIQETSSEVHHVTKTDTPVSSSSPGVDGEKAAEHEDSEELKVVIVVEGEKQELLGKGTLEDESVAHSGAVNGARSLEIPDEKVTGEGTEEEGKSGDGATLNGSHEMQNGGQLDSPELEEEFSFLRSLGWNEEDGGEGALTEEEINAFLKKLPCQGKKAKKLPMPTRTFSRPPVTNRAPQLYKDSSCLTRLHPSRTVVAGSVSSISSGYSSSDSDDEAQK